MAAFDNSEAWRQIPPEEKLEMMAQSHSVGLLSALGTVIVASTCAIAFHEVVLMWSALVIAPIIFQIAASRSWKEQKPKTILKYLAARSAARRYAYSAQAEDLTLDLVFRGTFAELTENKLDEDYEAPMIASNERDVWITLFRDTIVIMSEKIGGAKREFAYPIDHKLEVSSRSEDEKDYSTSKEVILTITQPSENPLIAGDIKKSYLVKSTSPGALVVFEKKIIKRKQQKEFDEIQRQRMIAPAASSEDLDLTADDEFFQGSLA